MIRGRGMKLGPSLTFLKFSSKLCATKVDDGGKNVLQIPRKFRVKGEMLNFVKYAFKTKTQEKNK